ncbi:hypothetical protein QP028_01945 [Corynebacterium suedekumii]|nr:hypothetical protein QP028_01945 [Corynebacterium suedekumii]
MSRISPLNWPVIRQLKDGDPFGRAHNVQSRKSAELNARVTEADRVVKSVCPYCAVGCGQLVYVKDEKRHPDRGRPGFADLPRAPVPQGFGLRAAGQLLHPGHRGALPRPEARRNGRSSTRSRRWT